MKTLKVLLGVYDRMITSLFALAGLLLTLMVLAILWEAISRTIPLYAPIWLSTFTEYSLSLLTMLIAPYLVRIRGHVTMDIFDNMVSPTSLKWWTTGTDIICVILCVILAYYSSITGFNSFIRGEIDVQAIDLPRWLPYSFLAPGFALCATEFARHLALKFSDQTSNPTIGRPGVHIK